MFKIIAALTALVCISSAVSTGSKDSEATVISNTFTDDGAGNFAFQYETSNAIKGEAKGNLKTITNADGKDGQGEVQQGSYSYVGDDGKTYQLKWVADENGFQPQADYIPTTSAPSNPAAAPTVDPRIDIRINAKTL